MKYRTVGLATNVLTAMVMVVRQLPGGEIQPAMKTGLIDAAEFNNPTSDSQFGMQDVSKHYHLGSFHSPRMVYRLTYETSIEWECQFKTFCLKFLIGALGVGSCECFFVWL